MVFCNIFHLKVSAWGFLLNISLYKLLMQQFWLIISEPSIDKNKSKVMKLLIYFFQCWDKLLSLICVVGPTKWKHQSMRWCIPDETNCTYTVYL